MKKYTSLIYIYLLIIPIANIVCGQNLPPIPAELHYSMSHGEHYDEVKSEKSSGCNNTSPFWNTNELYIPNEDFENIKVRLNFIFMHKDDSTGMFIEGNPEHDIIIDKIISRTNKRYNELINSTDADCYVSEGFVSSSKIQFVPNIIHINDEYGWNNENDDAYKNCPGTAGWYLNYIDDQISNCFSPLNIRTKV